LKFVRVSYVTGEGLRTATRIWQLWMKLRLICNTYELKYSMVSWPVTIIISSHCDGFQEWVKLKTSHLHIVALMVSIWKFQNIAVTSLGRNHGRTNNINLCVLIVFFLIIWRAKSYAPDKNGRPTWFYNYFLWVICRENIVQSFKFEYLQSTL